MKRKHLIVAFSTIGACVGVVFLWYASGSDAAAPAPSSMRDATPSARTAESQAAVPTDELDPGPINEAVSNGPTAPAMPSEVEHLTAKTLAGTKWKDGMVDVEFMADGRWKMNGRICAKWVVEGNRVKIFDDKGEVHYVDIVGDVIEFNGKKIGRMEG